MQDGVADLIARKAANYVRERRRGAFRRSMTLPEGLDEDKTKARFEGGVLEVTVEGAAAVAETGHIQTEGSRSQAGFREANEAIAASSREGSLEPGDQLAAGAKDGELAFEVENRDAEAPKK